MSEQDKGGLVMRRPDGTLMPGGANLNPKGRNKALPSWFMEAGEPALKHIMACAQGDEVDERVSRAECCFRLVERVYGKVPMAAEDRESADNGVAALLLALARKPGE